MRILRDEEFGLVFGGRDGSRDTSIGGGGGGGGGVKNGSLGSFFDLFPDDGTTRKWLNLDPKNWPDPTPEQREAAKRYQQDQIDRIKREHDSRSGGGPNSGGRGRDNWGSDHRGGRNNGTRY